MDPSSNAGFFIEHFDRNSFCLKIQKLDFLPKLDWNFPETRFQKCKNSFYHIFYSSALPHYWVNWLTATRKTGISRFKLTCVFDCFRKSQKSVKLIFKLPKLDLKTPKLDLKMPKLDLKMPKLDLKTPKLDFPAIWRSGMTQNSVEKKKPVVPSE